MIRRIGFVVALAVMLLPSGFAQVEVKQEDDLDSIRKKAEQGDAKAQFKLGLVYYNGEGGRQDHQEAAKWLRKAAQQGDVDAQASLCMLRYSGWLPQDYREAAKWCRKAAERGDKAGQLVLGELYRTGQGVTQDYQEAFRWYRKSAEQEYTPAEYALGHAYHGGEGVPQDYLEAANWYRKAARKGDASAQGVLGAMYMVSQDNVRAHKWLNLAASKSSGKARDDTVKLRDRLAEEMTREQIAEAQKLAREWKPGKAGE